MTMVEVAPSTLRKVKEVIDFIYELTSPENGYRGSMHKNGTRFSCIVGILVKRGIVLRSGTNKFPVYKWFNPSQAPTKPLYNSVGSELVLKERETGRRSYKNCCAKKHVSEPAKEPVVEPVKPAVLEAPAPTHTIDEEVRRATLSMFSFQELWDELKKRGGYIENNKLAVKTVQFFE